MTLFYKLAENIDIPTDRIVAELKSITKKIHLPNNTSSFLGVKGWQSYDYPSNIEFIRCWNSPFQEEIFNALRNVQSQTADTNYLTDAFKQSIFLPTQLSATRITGKVLPHYDQRNYAITVGLENSNKYKIYIMNASRGEFVYDESYTINDGDVYITDVSKLHAVVPINSSDFTRYCLTITI